MFRSFRNAFFTGLLTLLPLGITLYVVNFVLKLIGMPAGKLFFGKWACLDSIGKQKEIIVAIVAVALVVVCVAIVGYISRYFFGRIFIGATERIIGRVPFVSSVYNTSKQLIKSFSSGQRAAFQQVVRVKLFHDQCHAIGFVTGEVTGELKDASSQKMVSIFVPTTPNPTTGFLFFVPENECMPLNMSVADAMKAIISLGAFTPTVNPKIENPGNFIKP